MIDKVTIPSNFFAPLELLTNEQLGRLVKCLFSYQSGEEVTPDADIEIVYALLCGHLDTEKAKKEKRRQAGSLGGRSHTNNDIKQTEANESKCKQTEASVSKPKQNEANVSKDITACQSNGCETDSIELSKIIENKETERETERKNPPAPPIKKEKDKEKESQNILRACEEISPVQSAPDKAFNFKQAMLSLNVPEDVLSDWLKVRQKKRASNTKTAFKGIEREIKASGVSAADCVWLAAENSWIGIKAQWVQETIKRMGGKLPTRDDKEDIFSQPETPKVRTIYDTIREQQEKDAERAKAVANGYIPSR